MAHRTVVQQDPISVARRRCLVQLAALPLLGAGFEGIAATLPLPKRRVPVSGEQLPVIGLGSTKAVMQLGEPGAADALAAVLRALRAAGGTVVDTWSRDPALDIKTGEVFQRDGLLDDLFIATKIDTDGREAGIAQLEANERAFGRASDLVQIFSLRDADIHWPTLVARKAEGKTRYIGVTVSSDSDHPAIMAFMRRERPDFIQVNYSVVETAAESGVLPMAADLGVAVIVNRPFTNGEYFQRVRDRALPDWASAAGIKSWAQFSLTYVLANPAITCVLTETTNPAHLADNLVAAFLPSPDDELRRQMRDYIRQMG
ncbi:MAG: aldo/keto reductase [Gammaproteobacteria bacterium]|nr:aldo/keto reductase [Gammaproteobacteria bacterium]